MDAIILFVIGIGIYLIGFMWRCIDKKLFIRNKRETEKKLEIVEKKKGDIEHDDYWKPVLRHVSELEKNNYIHKEEMSDKDRKFIEKNDKGKYTIRITGNIYSFGFSKRAGYFSFNSISSSSSNFAL